MKKALTILSLLLSAALAYSQIATDTNICPDIKSVYLSRSDNELEAPFLRLSEFGEGAEQLLLRFDILSPQTDHLRYRLRHCTSDWQPDNLEPGEFLSGAADNNISNFQSSFTTLTGYTNYYQLIPDQYSFFLASGNYLIEVYPAEYPDSILFTRRFCVYEEQVDIDAAVLKPSGAYGNFNRDQEVNVAVTPRRGSFLIQQSDYYRVVVQQNRRTDLQRALTFSGFSGNTLRYDWQAANVFPGGNNFRYFDLSNLQATMYHVQRIEQWGGETFAFLQPDEDRSHKAYTQYNSLNGGMKTNIRDRNNPHIEADYVWVNFSLPLERPFLDGTVHIIGELTQWNLGDDSRMEWNAKYKAYTKRMLIKQGYYSYQLLFLPTGESEALTATLEGDHYVTPNSYTIYVYYHSPGARYDRLVGLLRTTSIH
jgi:hypothetical protein